MTQPEALLYSHLPLIDAPYTAVVLCAGRAAYAANLTVVLSVILKVADFIVALRTTARLPRFTLPVEAFTSPGGDEGNRTPVRKVFAKAFYERSCRFKIPLPQHPTTGYTAR